MKIILTKNRIERIVDITDVEIFTADTGCIIATIGNNEWFVKDGRPRYMASLSSMYANAGGSFVYLARNKLVRRDQIVGRFLGFDGAVAAILADGQKIKVSRRRRPGFNRLIRDKLTVNMPQKRP